MYLIARVAELTSKLIDSLAKEGIKSACLPILQLKPLEFNSQELIKLIKAYDNLVLISPSTIRMINPIIATPIKPDLKLLLMGKSSSSYLINQYNYQVSYPIYTSGIQGLINEQLINSLQSYLICGSTIINQHLQNYLIQQNIRHHFYSLYQSIDLLETNMALVEQSLLTTNSKGIIIYTSQIAQSLVKCAKINTQINNYLHDNLIITTHSKISQVMLNNGFTQLIETKSPSTQDVLDTIRKLEHEPDTAN
ncbi:MAG: hypothetical protein RLZZ293_580 [Pseudomonadota bacterium]|jgi:uroporphyrinogen-III synthase